MFLFIIKKMLQETQEIWKHVKDFEEEYMVSNLGQIKSLRKNKILSLLKKDDYLFIVLYNKLRDQKRIAIHRLVADNFLLNPNKCRDLIHKNGDKFDNRADNIEWVNRNHIIRSKIISSSDLEEYIISLNNHGEEWKSVKDYEGYYIVSNKGNVRRVGIDQNLKPAFRMGYLAVGLSKDGKCKTSPIHRLVAKNFISYEKHLVVNHKDGNKFNNSLDNLEWCTHSENSKHSKHSIGIKKRIKTRQSNEKTEFTDGKESVYDKNYIITIDGCVYSKKSNKFLIPGTDASGIKTVCINNKNFYIHRLVAECYLENKNNCPIVNHKNLDKGDNRLSNLEWCTYSDNMKHYASNKKQTVKKLASPV